MACWPVLEVEESANPFARGALTAAKYATTSDTVVGRDHLMAVWRPLTPGSPLIYYDTTTENLRRYS